MTRAYTLHANDTNRFPILDRCIAELRALPASESHRIEIKPVADIRTNDQNRKMWAMLNDIARQVPWPINGVRCLIAPEDWKDLITAGLAKHQRIAQGLEGGVVMLGSRTSKMRKKELAELIEYIYYVGADKGVVWDEAANYINESATEAA
jgi:hypothetical protein